MKHLKDLCLAIHFFPDFRGNSYSYNYKKLAKTHTPPNNYLMMKNGRDKDHNTPKPKTIIFMNQRENE